MKVEFIRSRFKSVRFPLASWEEKILGFFANQEAYLLVWKEDEVMAGNISQNRFYFYQSSFQPEFVQEARIFNEKAELYLRRWEDVFVARWREEDAGERLDEADECNEFYAMDEFHYVMGSVQDYQDGWLEITEKNRGFHFRLPSAVQVTGKIRYKVRNYYKADEDGQLYFVDARLCGFYKEDGAMLRGGSL